MLEKQRNGLSMKEKLHQIKLIFCEESSAKNGKYIYVKKTVGSFSSFHESFTGEDEDLLNDDQLLVKNIEDDCNETYHRHRDQIDEENLAIYDSQYKKAKDKFFNLIKDKKGLLIAYMWGDDDDFDQGIISFTTIEPIPLALISTNFLVREIAKACYES